MWRAYEAGQTEFCGHHLPEGLKRNQKLEHPIITPTTKAVEGHDEDTSEEAILQSGVVSQKDWETIKAYAFKIYEFGTEYAATKDLILVDTKLEFGRNKQGEIMLIDEILTPDSSRYFIKSTYQENFEKGEEPKQLSKEFVRQWLIENGFQGLEGQTIPDMPEDFVNLVTDRYIELFEKISGRKFEKADNSDITSRIQQNVEAYLKSK
jgi:phosphoribosylaminoimidazole-succinocarboxamide synthase